MNTPIEKKRRPRVRAIAYKFPVESSNEQASVRRFSLEGLAFELGEMASDWPSNIQAPQKRKRGRPKKLTSDFILEIPKQRGPKPKWGERECRALINYVANFKLKNPRAKDKKALEKYIEEISQHLNLHSHNPKVPKLKRLWNVLIEARKLYPDNSK